MTNVPALLYRHHIKTFGEERTRQGTLVPCFVCEETCCKFQILYKSVICVQFNNRRRVKCYVHISRNDLVEQTHDLVVDADLTRNKYCLTLQVKTINLNKVKVYNVGIAHLFTSHH